MSGLMPFEGSGDSPYDDDSLTPLEPSSTTVASYSSYKGPTTAEASYTAGSSYEALTTTTPAVTATIASTTYTTTTGVTHQDHQSTKSLPFLLPLWGWAVLLLGIVVLLSLTAIWITLVVGWKKNKKRRKTRDDEVNSNHQRSSSRRNSNLWIDENDGQGQPVEGTCTRAVATRLPGSSNVDGAGFPNATYVKQHNDILKEMKSKSSLFLSEQAGDRGSVMYDHEGQGVAGTRGAHYHERYAGHRDTRARDHKGRQDARPHSHTLPRSPQVSSNVTTDARLSHRLIHLQPATTSTFKRRQKHTQNSTTHEHSTIHSDTPCHAASHLQAIGKPKHTTPTHSDTYVTSDPQAVTVDTGAKCDILETKVNVCESAGRFDVNLAVTPGCPALGDNLEDSVVNPFNYRYNPVDRDSPARGLELMESAHVRGPQINNNPLPPRTYHDFDNYDVTTFSQYAFNTL